MTEANGRRKEAGWTVYPGEIGRAVEILGAAAGLVGLVCVGFGLLTLGCKDRVVIGAKEIILALWIVLPPAWFTLEYHFLYKRHGLMDTLEEFKYGQEVAAKFWVAVSTVLSALYVGPSVLDKLSKHLGSG
jgi:hypothetical protein